jgi:hypothetical protein
MNVGIGTEAAQFLFQECINLVFGTVRYAINCLATHRVNLLQVPMKNLYLKHIDMKMMGHQHLPGTLEISDTGQLYLHILSTLGCYVHE